MSDNTESLYIFALVDGTRKEKRYFCTPLCVRKHVERGAIELATLSYEEHVRAGWVDHCHRCRQTDKTARFIVIDGPSCETTFDDEIGGRFCSMKCFIEALHEEEAYWKAQHLGSWYADIPFGEEEVEKTPITRRPNTLEPSASKSRKHGRKEERLPLSRMLAMI